MIVTWEQYTAGDGEYISVERWGKDHWSTFAYVEVCAVDSKGLIDNRRMRCNPRLHRELANVSGLSGVVDGSKHPTRLKDKETLDRHDDWSCIEDMVKAELITAEFRIRFHGQAFGGNEARIALTKRGLEVAAALRAHKANGGQFSTFEANP